MPRLTRRKAQTWLAPLRKTLQEMRSGYLDSARGYAVMTLRNDGNAVRVDYCIQGFRRLINRLFKDAELPALARIERRLANGVLVSQADIDAAMREVRETEDRLCKITTDQMLSAVRTEEIAIELHGAAHAGA